MSELDDLLAACIASPDDDAPRLVWADAVGGERGELVVLQCRLAREELPPAEMGALIARHDELLAAHGKEWSGFGDEGGARRYVFRRGFVDAVELDLYDVPLDVLFARMPLVRSVHVVGISRSIAYHESGIPEGPEPVPFLAALLESPALQRLRGIEIDDVYLHEADGDTEWNSTFTRYGDEACEVVAASQRLTGFRTFAMREMFEPRGMAALLRSNVLASVETFAVEYGEADVGQIAELFAAMPNVRALDVYSSFKLREIAAVIPPNVVELRTASVNDDDIAALAASPIAAQLERLAIHTSRLHDLPLAAFPRLRALELAHTNVPPNDVLRAPPALRELRAPELATADALAIGEALGSRLACLDLLGQEAIGRVCGDELRQRVVGHVRTGRYASSDAPLGVGVNPREPWLRYGLVEGKW